MGAINKDKFSQNSAQKHSILIPKITINLPDVEIYSFAQVEEANMKLQRKLD